MKNRALYMTVVVIVAFAINIIYPPAYADSSNVNEGVATVYGGKTVNIAKMPVFRENIFKTPWNNPPQPGAVYFEANVNNDKVNSENNEAKDINENPPPFAGSITEPWREIRGTWIATVKNINMPSGMDEAAFTKWAAESMDFLAENQLNACMFQVRPSGDALYKSSLAPWSSFITGKDQGSDPGYDPLAIMISQAHERGIELHAWINPYRITMPSDKLESLSKNNIAVKNPSWVVSYAGQHYLNPGIPEVRTHLVEIVGEIVNNYDVDAIHIDDYFYPYPVSGGVYNDDAQYSLYAGGHSNKGDWRRDNITNLVRDLYSTIKSQKSYVQLGISPFGVWRNKATDATGSDTNAGHECYDSLYADTRTWINEGIIDYIAPQIYWSRELTQAPYETLLNWWNNEIKTQAVNKPVNLYIGQANYKAGGDAEKKWLDPNEISDQVALNRQADRVGGQIHYSFSSIKENKLNHFGLLGDNYYKHISLPPVLAVNQPQSSLPITEAIVKRNNNGVEVNISTYDVNTRKLLIYRVEGSSTMEYTQGNLLDVLYKTGDNTIYTDVTALSGKSYTYGVKTVSIHGLINENAKTFTIN